MHNEANVAEETRVQCPRCQSNTIGPGQSQCKSCDQRDKALANRKMALVAASHASKNEMAAGGIAGFQLPLGAQERKKKVKECLEKSGDLNEAHVAAFYSIGDRIDEFFDALDFGQFGAAANIVREEIIRHVVRLKLNEVVRKKQGGGGYVLYAPNKGKKHASKPVATFPTKLAAKRAQLARFPPKDPKKLARLRKEIQRLMKDPKKRAEAERRAQKQQGTVPSGPPPAPKKRKHEARELVERAILAEAINLAVRHRVTEGLFKEEQAPSQWDEYISKIASNVLSGDQGYKRIQKRMNQAIEGALAQALRIIKKHLGGQASVKAGQTGYKNGVAHIPFSIVLDGAEVGPVYLYVEGGLPRLEMDQAKDGFAKVDPETAKSIRGSLATAEDALAGMNTVQAAVAERDQFLSKLESKADAMIAKMSPLEISMLKRLLVKKYRSASK